ncbi:hypothetical protein EW026_g3249 [Hermanssonia centrifuga]|uniref:DNA 3'-5' helicase n=1 Tax=Hermanssonia centrifuga TaxID=98765 RepID=A0A4S4KKR2_9APHY|nr:hypothetical protein EW026_g3249 [Hermanssonia centrifuga]
MPPKQFPRNNLDDVLLKAQNMPPMPPQSPARPQKVLLEPTTASSQLTHVRLQTKFRPASTATPAFPIQHSFSTPLPSAVARNRSPVQVSSAESTPLTSIPAKRASPHIAHAAESPPKRVKYDTIPLSAIASEKENIFAAPSSLKGKAREQPSRTVDFPRPASTSTASRALPPQSLSAASAVPRRFYPLDYSDIFTMSLEELTAHRFGLMQLYHQLGNMRETAEEDRLGPAVLKSIRNYSNMCQDELQCIQALTAALKAGAPRALPTTKWTVSNLLPSHAEHVTASHVDGLHPGAAGYNNSYRPDDSIGADIEYNQPGLAAGDEDVVVVPSSEEDLWASWDDNITDNVGDISDGPSYVPPPPPPLSSGGAIATPPPSQSTYSLPVITPAFIRQDPTLLKTAFYPSLKRTLNDTFGLTNFRPNQLEAISSFMAGEDVFVLMPTGGGKSLCFQLPAVDQVVALEAKGVDVACFKKEQTTEEAHQMHMRLNDPNRRPAMVYITPEKLEHSERLRSDLRRLQERGLLVGIIIDEAHCITTWGRQFRESYAKLEWLRRELPNVPIMALTATANCQAVEDIILRLNIRGCKRYVMSFNRPNLMYKVERKGKDVLPRIIEFIQLKHRGQTGIVYCGAKAKCEDVAGKLRAAGIRARHYHADMDTDDKNAIQKEWQSGKIQVIVATIAFGMGIDKADVRFVIHFSMPTSLSNYYQETGRAGRDGKPSDCILFYAFSDAVFPLKRAREEAKDDDDRAGEEDIRRVVQFCEEEVVCRRSQVLSYFDEKFDAAQCRDGCDNCQSKSPIVEEDVTQDATKLIRLLMEIKEQMPEGLLVDVFRGRPSGSMKNRDLSYLQYMGAGKDVSKPQAGRIVHKLLANGIFQPESTVNKSGWNTTYLQVSRRAKQFIDRGEKLIIRFRETPKVARAPRSRAATATGQMQTGSAEAGPSRQRRSRVKPAEIVDDPIAQYLSDEEDLTYLGAIEDDTVAVSIPSISRPAAMTRARTLPAIPTRPGSSVGSRSFLATPDSDDDEIECLDTPPPNTQRAQNSRPRPASAATFHDPSPCFTALKERRDQLEGEQDMDLSDVFNDEALGYLACVLPADVVELRHKLLEIGISLDESSVSKQYAAIFLDICIQFKTGNRPVNPPSPVAIGSPSKRARTKPPSVIDLRGYRYNDTTSNRSKPSSSRM